MDVRLLEVAAEAVKMVEAVVEWWVVEWWVAEAVVEAVVEWWVARTQW